METKEDEKQKAIIRRLGNNVYYIGLLQFAMFVFTLIYFKHNFKPLAVYLIYEFFNKNLTAYRLHLRDVRDGKINK